MEDSLPYRKTDGTLVVHPAPSPFAHTGGPRSHVASVYVRSCLPDDLGATVVEGGCRLPWADQENVDLRARVQELCTKLGFADVEEAASALGLPDRPLQALPWRAEEIPAPVGEREILRHALTLARCGPSGYRPDSPIILSHTRLSRSVRLQTLDIAKYYDLD